MLFLFTCIWLWIRDGSKPILESENLRCDILFIIMSALITPICLFSLPSLVTEEEIKIVNDILIQGYQIEKYKKNISILKETEDAFIVKDGENFFKITKEDLKKENWKQIKEDKLIRVVYVPKLEGPIYKFIAIPYFETKKS